jgi:hypothetical protein
VLAGHSESRIWAQRTRRNAANCELAFDVCMVCLHPTKV